MPSPVETPPADPFWQKYSNRHEFPLATVGAVLIHITAAAFIVFVLFGLANRDPERAAVPITFLDASDDHGDGTQTPGGVDVPFQGRSELGPAASDFAADPTPLPTPTPDTPTLPTPNAEVAAVPDSSRLSGLDKFLPKGPPGANRGVGDKNGNGPAGANSTGARNMRWVLRFRTSDGHDYVQQLALIGAKIAVPVPPENKDQLYFADLKQPKGRVATAADQKDIAAHVRFTDGRRDSVEGIGNALKLDFVPKSFAAVFPKAFEEELERKERAFRNRRPEDIETTTFRVAVRDGKVEVVVDDQQIKR